MIDQRSCALIVAGNCHDENGTCDQRCAEVAGADALSGELRDREFADMTGGPSARESASIGGLRHFSAVGVPQRELVRWIDQQLTPKTPPEARH